MTTSGLVGGSNALQAKALSQQIAVKLLSVPNSLQTNSSTIRIDGKVIGIGADKTLLLLTDYGEVNVRTKGAFNAREGQRVQIDVPPGATPKDSVIRPPSGREVSLSSKEQENPSLLKVVADKIISLARKAELSASTLTQTQNTSIDNKVISAKTADLTIGASVRLSPVAGELLNINNVSQVINTKLPLYGGLFPNIQGLGGTVTSAVPSQGFGQTALFQSVFNFVNTGQSSQSQSGRGAGGQISPQYLGQFTTQSGSINAGNGIGQNYVFPPVSGIDGRLTGNVNTLFGRSISTSFGQNAESINFLLNGQASSLTFQVIGITQSNQPVVLPMFATHLSGHVNSNPQPFVVQFPANNVQLGSLLSFSAIGFSQNGGLVAPIDQFSSLMLAIKELKVANPAMAHTLSALAPSAGASTQQVGSSALFLFSALKGGKLDGWLGDGSSKLMAKHKILELLERALKDGVTPKTVQNAQTGDWRAYSFPVQLQETAVPVSLYVQDHGQQQSEQGEEEDEIKITRFVFEFDLTRMGEIQVDGMMREKNLDIFIRTRREISSDMRKMVRSVYLNALERSDLTGDVAFQSDPKRWVTVEDQYSN